MSSAVPQTTPYSVFAKSNAQDSGANNDCPTDLVSIIIGVQQQASANCLNDANMVQDSDGASIASAPINAAPSQAIDIGVGIVPPPEVGCPDDYVWDLTLDQPIPISIFLLPEGTVLCSFSEELNVREDVVISGTGEVPYPIIITQPETSGICPADGYSAATASSGNPPLPLEIGDPVCVTPGIP